jgi:NAD(P)-dependent dehydrogenase (short-subunit alcohol dehydrogenase family)
MKTLQNKIAIVTGGTRAIGKAITSSLLREGATVVVCSRNQKEIDAAVKELSSLGKISGLVADVSLQKDAQTFVEHVLKEYGKIDILVNNAGIYGPIGPLEENDHHKWVQTFQINMFGMMYMTQLVIPSMKKQKNGKIINLAGGGVGGKRPLARFTAYYASKTAVVAFTEAMGVELAEFGIQVNCISPGAVVSKFTDQLLADGKDKAGDMMYEQALKQKETGGDPPELAGECVAFLASKAADHINGKMISAKWEKAAELKKLKPMKENLYNLRRIDDTFFYEKE